jgi:hypothetical protein
MTHFGWYVLENENFFSPLVGMTDGLTLAW